ERSAVEAQHYADTQLCNAHSETCRAFCCSLPVAAQFREKTRALRTRLGQRIGPALAVIAHCAGRDQHPRCGRRLRDGCAELFGQVDATRAQCVAPRFCPSAREYTFAREVNHCIALRECARQTGEAIDGSAQRDVRPEAIARTDGVAHERRDRVPCTEQALNQRTPHESCRSRDKYAHKLKPPALAMRLAEQRGQGPVYVICSACGEALVGSYKLVTAMHTLEQLVSSLQSNVPGMLQLTRELCHVNSYSTNLAGVNDVGRLLEQAFQPLSGLHFRRERGGKSSGDHLFWSTAQSTREPALLLIGHHDTVFPPGHFEGWREEGGRAYAPGCLDMKGGLALLWGVLKTLSDASLLDKLAVVVACVADEETGSLDSRAHLEALAKNASCALVFESGRDNDAIVTRRRGVGGIHVQATGKAAHAGNAHRDGANAIWALAKFVELAQSLTDYDRGLTVNVGTIVGGTSPNTVPASAEAVLDLRFETVSDAEALLTKLRAAAASAAVPGTQLTLTGGVKRLPMERTAASAALYEAYAECQRAAGLGAGEHPLVGGGSDANTVAGVGLPAIDGLGLRGRGFHTTSEYIELDSFKLKSEALLRFLVTYIRAS
ncbi:MAG: hypothetical protein RL701_2564, partial [Pseudomonadota bacterium]